MGLTTTATMNVEDIVSTRKHISAPVRRRSSGADLFVVALALSAVAALALRSAAAQGVPVLSIAADDEEVLIPWKKARPRGPPRFGKRALPSLFGDVSTATAFEGMPHHVWRSASGLQKRAVMRVDLPKGVEFLQRLFRLDDAGKTTSGGVRPLPALLLECYARYA